MSTDEVPLEITVLTLNVWGLLVISKQRTERLVEIGRHIARRVPAPHIVALQECFVREDYEAIRRETRFALPYGKYYEGGAFGSGLVILSRWPIEDSWHAEYPLGGRPTGVLQGDWYVGKGIARVRVRMGSKGDMMEVFNTHTQSPYPGDPFVVHRLSQSWNIAKQFESATLRERTLVLGLGDYNMKPCSLQHKIITARAPLMRDTWRVLHPDSSLGNVTDAAEIARGRPVPTVAFNIHENGCTSNNKTNTWRWSSARRKLLGRKHVDPELIRVGDDESDERGHRLDYVFANVAGKEEDGEWEEEYNVASADSIAQNQHHTDGNTLDGEREEDEEDNTFWSGKTADRTKRGVHFDDNLTSKFTITSSTTAAGVTDLSAIPKPVWVIRSARVAVTERHPTLDCSLSDHYGYEVTFVKRIPKRREDPIDAYPDGSRALGSARGTYLDSPTPSERQLSSSRGGGGDISLSNLTRSPSDAEKLAMTPRVLSAEKDNSPLTDAQYTEILELIAGYSASKQKEQKWRYVYFALSLATSAGLLISVWFIPRWGAFVFLFFGMINFCWGVLNGLYALLFLGRERRCLLNFEWEVSNARSRSRGGMEVEVELES